MGGVVAAGHPLSAEAGAEVLREGGNAVDAAIGAVLASFAVESPLTGFGAGGYMLVHREAPGGVPGSGRKESDSDAPSAGVTEQTLIDFFVAAPGLDGIERRAELVPVPVHFDAETSQTFFVGPASCG
ncbi:MAG TPA: gamma-glutamyltransferase, partial [Solirubrobacterales bacterium]|nr:gamma-glutamyltransferase [Solirubrobacterales bacterium]